MSTGQTPDPAATWKIAIPAKTTPPPTPTPAPASAANWKIAVPASQASPSAPAGTLSFDDLKSYWTAAGGDPAKAELMAHVAMAESSGNTTASNSYTEGGKTYHVHGPWQISDIHAEYAKENLNDPLTNAKAAVALNKSSGMSPWLASKDVWGKYDIASKPLPTMPAPKPSASPQAQQAAMAQLGIPQPHHAVATGKPPKLPTGAPHVETEGDADMFNQLGRIGNAILDLPMTLPGQFGQVTTMRQMMVAQQKQREQIGGALNKIGSFKIAGHSIGDITHPAAGPAMTAMQVLGAYGEMLTLNSPVVSPLQTAMQMVNENPLHAPEAARQAVDSYKNILHLIALGKLDPASVAQLDEEYGMFSPGHIATMHALYPDDLDWKVLAHFPAFSGGLRTGEDFIAVGPGLLSDAAKGAARVGVRAADAVAPGLQVADRVAAGAEKINRMKSAVAASRPYQAYERTVNRYGPLRQVARARGIDEDEAEQLGRQATGIHARVTSAASDIRHTIFADLTQRQRWEVERRAEGLEPNKHGDWENDRGNTKAVTGAGKTIDDRATALRAVIVNQTDDVMAQGLIKHEYDKSIYTYRGGPTSYVSLNHPMVDEFMRNIGSGRAGLGKPLSGESKRFANFDEAYDSKLFSNAYDSADNLERYLQRTGLAVGERQIIKSMYRVFGTDIPYTLDEDGHLQLTGAAVTTAKTYKAAQKVAAKQANKEALAEATRRTGVTLEEAKAVGVRQRGTTLQYPPKAVRAAAVGSKEARSEALHDALAAQIKEGREMAAVGARSEAKAEEAAAPKAAAPKTSAGKQKAAMDALDAKIDKTHPTEPDPDDFESQEEFQNAYSAYAAQMAKSGKTIEKGEALDPHEEEEEHEEPEEPEHTTATEKEIKAAPPKQITPLSHESMSMPQRSDAKSVAEYKQALSMWINRGEGAAGVAGRQALVRDLLGGDADSVLKQASSRRAVLRGKEKAEAKAKPAPKAAAPTSEAEQSLIAGGMSPENAKTMAAQIEAARPKTEAPQPTKSETDLKREVAKRAQAQAAATRAVGTTQKAIDKKLEDMVALQQRAAGVENPETAGKIRANIFRMNQELEDLKRQHEQNLHQQEYVKGQAAAAKKAPKGSMDAAREAGTPVEPTPANVEQVLDATPAEVKAASESVQEKVTPPPAPKQVRRAKAAAKVTAKRAEAEVEQTGEMSKTTQQAFGEALINHTMDEDSALHSRAVAALKSIVNPDKDDLKKISAFVNAYNRAYKGNFEREMENITRDGLNAIQPPVRTGLAKAVSAGPPVWLDPARVTTAIQQKLDFIDPWRALPAPVADFLRNQVLAAGVQESEGFFSGVSKLFEFINKLNRVEIIQNPLRHGFMNMPFNMMASGARPDEIAEAMSKDPEQWTDWLPGEDAKDIVARAEQNLAVTPFKYSGSLFPGMSSGTAMETASHVPSSAADFVNQMHQIYTEAVEKATPKGGKLSGAAADWHGSTAVANAAVSRAWAFNQSIVFSMLERRLAVLRFRNFVREGMSDAKAGIRTRKVLGDYDNVSRVGLEHTLSKALLFYPWLKTVIPLMLSTMWQRPQMIWGPYAAGRRWNQTFDPQEAGALPEGSFVVPGYRGGGLPWLVSDPLPVKYAGQMADILAPEPAVTTGGRLDPILHTIQTELRPFPYGFAANIATSELEGITPSPPASYTQLFDPAEPRYGVLPPAGAALSGLAQSLPGSRTFASGHDIMTGGWPQLLRLLTLQPYQYAPFGSESGAMIHSARTWYLQKRQKIRAAQYALRDDRSMTPKEKDEKAQSLGQALNLSWNAYQAIQNGVRAGTPIETIRRQVEALSNQ